MTCGCRFQAGLKGGSSMGLQGGSVFETRPLIIFLCFLLLLLGILVSLMASGTIQFATNDSKNLSIGFVATVMGFLFLYIVYLNFNSNCGY